MIKHRKAIVLGVVGAAAQLLVPRDADAAIPEWLRNTGLIGESIWTAGGQSACCSGCSQFVHPADQDGDWLRDDLENRLADVWKPYFIFDEHENDNGGGTSQPSLQSWEPRIVYQVRPIGDTWGQIVNVKIVYGILFRLDGGFRTANPGPFTCPINALPGGDHHSGDTELMIYNVRSYDWGTSWRLESIEGFNNNDNDRMTVDAGHPHLQWTPISGDFERPRLRVYFSAGKHHPFINGSWCEDAGGCDQDCGEGVERMANLHPWEYYTNVGEPENHPYDTWYASFGLINQPFTNELWHIGYANEHTWWADWFRGDCDDWGGGIFTGGMNAGPGNSGAWSLGWGAACVTPVHGLFNGECFW